MKTNNKRLIWFILPLLIFGVLIAMLFQRLGKPTEIVTNTAVNRPLPAFTLPLLSDPTQQISQDQLPNKPYLLNVWGSWCPTCKIEHPFLMTLAQQNIPLIGVNYKDELDNALDYLNQYGNPFLMSVRDEDGNLALDLGLTGAPETFVVDQNGQIRQHIIGEINEDNWQSRIAPCFNQLQILAKSSTSDNPDQQIQEACQ